MKNRLRKRQLYARCQSWDYFLELEAERLWLDMEPVGREFGSKDYDRLTKLDESANFPSEEQIQAVRIKHRRLLAAKISEEMDAARRTTPPSAEDAAAWVPVVDMDTNKVHWVPKNLNDEYNRLRFSDDGEP